MKTALKLHPGSSSAAVAAIEVEILRRAGGSLELRYVLQGDMAAVALPEPAAPAFTDGLWRETCLEAFVRRALEPAYCELNFAPSTAWAAYRFDACREGMARADEIGPPRIEIRHAPTVFELNAVVDLPEGLQRAPWRLAVSAVVRERDGRVSYWALRHPPGKPDFHHPDCFAIDLPAPDRT